MNLKIVFGNLPVKSELLVTPSAGKLELYNLDRVFILVERLSEPPVETKVEEESSVREKIRDVRDE